MPYPKSLFAPREYFDVLTDSLDDPKDEIAEREAKERRAEDKGDRLREDEEAFK